MSSERWCGSWDWRSGDLKPWGCWSSEESLTSCFPTRFWSCPLAEEEVHPLLAAPPSADACCRVHHCTWQLREKAEK